MSRRQKLERQDVKLSQLYMLRLYWDGCGESTTRWVYRADVLLLVKAYYRLHVNPGRNPHNNGETRRLRSIWVYDPMESYVGQYWWTSPTLYENGPMARIVDFDVRPERVIDFTKAKGYKSQEVVRCN